MKQESAAAETVNLLQDLGLKEYESRSFVALTQLTEGTAKDISEISEVPRTRVYSAIELLEAKGLVEVRHGSPKQFRAVSIEEAAATLRQRFNGRIETLQSQLDRLDPQEVPDEGDRVQEVWSLSGHGGIESRTHRLLAEADSEIVLLVVEEELLTQPLFDLLHEAVDRGVDIIIGGETDAIVGRLESELPSVQAFKTDLDWLLGPEHNNEVAISRLLLVDRTRLLVSSFYPDGDSEQAIFATGLENGVVVLIRRLISSGFFAPTVPGQ